MLIDTHCHLDFKDFKDDMDVVLKRSRDSGIRFIINVGSSMEGTARSIRIAEENDFIYAAGGRALSWPIGFQAFVLGLHPGDKAVFGILRDGVEKEVEVQL